MSRTPFVLSLGVLVLSQTTFPTCVELAYVAVNGPAPQTDEPRSPRQGAIALLVQASAAVAALLPV
jgi:hypothetical protein